MIGKLAGVVAAGAAVYATGKALAHRQRCWTVVHSRDGFKLELSATPLWAVLAEKAQEALPCTCSLPGWTYRAGLRRFGVHNDGSNDPLHSLGSLGYDLCVLRNTVAWRFTKQIATVAITAEEAQRWAPEWTHDGDECPDDAWDTTVGHQTFQPDDEQG